MINLGINLITFFVEFLITLIILINGYSVQKSLFKTVLCGLFAYGLGFIVYYFLENVYLNLITTLVVNFIFSHFGFKTNIKESIVNSVSITSLMTISEFICLSISSSILNVELLMTDLYHFIIFTAASKIIYLLLGTVLIHFIKRFRKKKMNQKIDTPIYLFIYPICTIITMFVYWIVIDKNIIDTQTKLYISVSVAFIFIAVIMTYAFYTYTSERNLEINRLQSELDRIQIEKEYYKLLDYQSDNIRKLAHDEKNHLLAIKSMSDTKQISDYIDSIYNDIQKYTPSGLTENKQLDVILNKYSVQCESEKITFTKNIKTANLSFMDDTDLISLISNILDNAVEAAKNSSEKRIDLSLNKVMGMASLTCSNSCDISPVSKNGQLLTSKSDKASHGLGTKIIKQTVRKYDGEYQWRYDENQKEFVTVVAFCENNS